MVAVINIDGLKLMANALKSIEANSARIKLYKVGPTYVFGTTYAELTVADFSGYADQNPGDPVVTYDSGANKAVVTFPQVTFEHDGGGTANDVVGWYIEITDPITGTPVLCMGGSFDAPITVDSLGDVINVQPVFKFKVAA